MHRFIIAALAVIFSLVIPCLHVVGLVQEGYAIECLRVVMAISLIKSCITYHKLTYYDDIDNEVPVSKHG